MNNDHENAIFRTAFCQEESKTSFGELARDCLGSYAMVRSGGAASRAIAFRTAGRKIDNRETAAGSESGVQAAVHGTWVAKMVIDEANNEAIAATVLEVRADLVSLYNRDIGELFQLGGVAYRVEPVTV